MRRITTRAFAATVASAVASAVAAAAMLTACSGRDRVATSASAGEVDARTPAAGMAPAPSGAIRTATRAGIGRYLTDADGRSLYMFAQDARNVSTCLDACAAAWPPFAGGAASGDAAVQSTMVGTIERTDARRQATYNGMPVYYYEDDKQAGDTEGQGKLEFGGLWYLVSPGGRPITTGAPVDR